jgi:hypothetical protein
MDLFVKLVCLLLCRATAVGWHSGAQHNVAAECCMHAGLLGCMRVIGLMAADLHPQCLGPDGINSWDWDAACVRGICKVGHYACDLKLHLIFVHQLL